MHHLAHQIVSSCSSPASLSYFFLHCTWVTLSFSPVNISSVGTPFSFFFLRSRRFWWITTQEAASHSTTSTLPPQAVPRHHQRPLRPPPSPIENTLGLDSSVPAYHPPNPNVSANVPLRMDIRGILPLTDMLRDRPGRGTPHPFIPITLRRRILCLTLLDPIMLLFHLHLIKDRLRIGVFRMIG